MNKAEQLIACLEGEIAKRDARIVELQRAEKNDAIAYKAALERQDELRAELAAIKAQEPVTLSDDVREYLQEGINSVTQCEDSDIDYDFANELAKLLDPLYAAPVSEAKAQGVVQWPDADEIMQMAFEDGQPADDASGYCFELEEFDLFIERLMSEVARLNATHVQQPKCKTCDDNGRIGGPSFYAPDEGGEPCPDCSAHAQQVSVPDGWKLVPVERITIALESVQNAMEDAYNNAYQECCGRGQGQCCGDPVAAWSDADTAIMDALAPAQRELSALLAAAPAAPEQ